MINKIKEYVLPTIKRFVSSQAFVYIIIFIVVAVIIFFSSPAGIRYIFSVSTANRTYVDNGKFNENYKDFCAIVDVVLEYRDEREGIEEKPEHEKEFFFLFAGHSNGKAYLYDPYNEIEIELSEEEQESLRKIDDSFYAGSSLDVIRVYEKGISFDIEGDSYSLVHTFDSSKPNFINWEARKSKIQKIRKGWYHVTGS